VIRRAAAPVHLVGHSFGGLSALAVALRKRVPLLSLTIAEAPAPEILRNMGEHRHYLAFRKMSEAYFRSFQAGETAAIEQMIDNSAVRATTGPERAGPLHWKWHIRGAPTGHRQMSQPLFRDGLAGAAEFGREVLQLWQAVAHWQHRLGIVDVNAGGEGQRRERGGEYVDQTQRRMIGHQVPAALGAILTLTERGLLERGHMFGSRRDPHSIRFPEAEGVDRPAGPRATRTAVTITHGLRRTGNL